MTPQLKNKQQQKKHRLPDRIPELSVRKFQLIAAIIIGLAASLRLFRLGMQEIWLDEAFSHYIATLPKWLPSILIDNNPPLYYLALRGWVKIFGTSEMALRLLSAVSSTAFVGIVIWVGAKIFSRNAGLWAGLIAAISPIQIYYAQEARGYALISLVLAAAILCVWRATQSDAWRDWALFSGCVTVALYLHYLSLAAILPIVLLPFFLGKRQAMIRGVLSTGLGCILFLPWVLWSFVFSPRPQVGMSWIENVWSETSKILAIPRSLEIFAIGSEAGLVPMWMHQFSAIEFPVLLSSLALCVLGILAVVAYRKESAANALKQSAGKFWLTAVLLGPLILFWTISWIKPIYAIGRYDVLAYPAFAILIGYAIARLQRQQGMFAFLLAALLAIPTLAKLIYYYDVPSTREAREMARTLDSGVRNTDVVVFTGLRALPVLYYLNRLDYVWEHGYCQNPSKGRRFYCRMYPRISEETPAGTDTQRLLGSADTARTELQDFVSALDPKDGTVWVVLWGDAPGGTLKIPRADQFLLDELDRLGFSSVPDPEAERLKFARYRKTQAAAAWR